MDNINTFKKTASDTTLPDAQKQVNLEFTKYQRSVLNRLGYFSISTTRIFQKGSTTLNSGEYILANNTILASFIYWTLHLNALLKGVFLAFLMLGYFGPVHFLDKIAASDYVLCFILIILSGLIWFRRYPFYEMLYANWKVLNAIFVKLGFPLDRLQKTNKTQRSVLITHTAIVWIGCFILTTQYFADPKYCTFTYSSVPVNNAYLSIAFAVHEFLFMYLSWNVYAASYSLCIYQGITVSQILAEMNETLEKLFQDNLTMGRTIDPRKVASGTEYDIERLLFDYKQLMLICKEFNSWVAYKALLMHICGGFQLISDVFSGTHVIKMPGAGFWDVWFYIEDCFAAGFMLLRMYFFMSLVSKASQTFLDSLSRYLTFPNMRRTQLRKVSRSLQIVALRVGPCKISPPTVLTILDTMGNYYVCAALW